MQSFCTCFKASSKLKVLAVSLCALEKLISLLIRSIFLSHSLTPKAKAHSVSRTSIFFHFLFLFKINLNREILSHQFLNLAFISSNKVNTILSSSFALSKDVASKRVIR